MLMEPRDDGLIDRAELRWSCGDSLAGAGVDCVHLAKLPKGDVVGQEFEAVGVHKVPDVVRSAR